MIVETIVTEIETADVLDLPAIEVREPLDATSQIPIHQVETTEPKSARTDTLGVPAGKIESGIETVAQEEGMVVERMKAEEDPGEIEICSRIG
jgi:hypothetical protein